MNHYGQEDVRCVALIAGLLATNIMNPLAKNESMDCVKTAIEIFKAVESQINS